MEAKGTTCGIRFKSARTRGGIIQDIFIENIKISDSRYVFIFDMDWYPEYSYTKLPDKYNYDIIPDYWKILLERVNPPEKGICILKNVKFRDFQISSCMKAFNVNGNNESPIDNFVFENIDLEADTPGKIINASNWKAINSTFKYNDGKKVEFINCLNMEGL